MKFNVKMMNFPWVFEHPLQKKIQVSAESSTDQIEIKFRLNGQIGLSPLLHKKPQVQIRRWWSRRDCGLTVVKGGVVVDTYVAADAILRFGPEKVATTEAVSHPSELSTSLAEGRPATTSLVGESSSRPSPKVSGPPATLINFTSSPFVKSIFNKFPLKV
ncbi:hypothetical protein G4B88_028352 [Cannabis sativa]|uniref:Uncharacterized protein n=1 Tax=Cannabis sativa TaxID=3483 RepID=A0A7J6FHF7_CANSA|nr:hypothetical protein G4B88_028352 [Cannabis sativa]